MTSQKLRILVTGGAGYIGSHVLKLLGEQSASEYELVVVDNLSTGSKQNIHFGELIIGDIGDPVILEQVFSKKVDVIFHFAGSVNVAESVEKPFEYYSNNTVSTLNLCEYAREHGVRAFIFSSTASVYGDVNEGAVSESSILAPQSPYAASKMMAESIIKDTAAISDMSYVNLRYFNVAGVCPSGLVGPRTEQATHLIKLCAEAACGKREKIQIFGVDYPTKDGSGVRDFIHVLDLASIHIEAMNYLLEGGDSTVINCGYSQGYSVKEVTTLARELGEFEFKIEETGRRAGDVSSVIADTTKLKELFKWKAKHNNLEEIIKDSIKWESR